MDPRQNFLEDALATCRRYKELSERALAQLSDEQLRWRPDPDANSVVTLVQHVGGNLRSRWSDYLASDGEKPDRNRDSEFVDDVESPAGVDGVGIEIDRAESTCR